MARTSLKKYLLGYRALVDARSDAQTRGIEGYFRRLRVDLPAIQKSLQRQERLHAPHYNIFRALGIERRETILHSPMLAQLLDPTASHGQGCLFLRAFFQVAHANVGITPPVEPLEAQQWIVRTEVYIGDGSIDLLIECPRQGYVLVIENKIDATEQHAQLWRYYKWMEQKRHDYPTRKLVFLTPTGRAPDSKKPVSCVRMSYQRDIREFLIRSIEQVQAPRVKELVSQYQAILEAWAIAGNQ
jgi:hypothetical protein